MIYSFEQRHAPGGRLCPAFGGSSKSSASTTSTTENRDMRVVGGNDSTNISANDSTLTVLTTDHGAISAGMTLGTQAIDAATTNSNNTIAASKSMFQGVLNSTNESQNAILNTTQKLFQGALNSSADANQSAIGAVNSANERLALAYQSGQAGDQTSLKYAGFIVVGLAAVMIFKK